ncbi:MAG: CotH kinase family protein [Methanococcaceae archaeon]
MRFIYSLIVLLLITSFSYSQTSFSNPDYGKPDVTFTSSNLPIIVIDTHGQNIKDEPKIIADMGIIFNGEGKINYLTNQFNDYKGKVGIEIRGSSSQQFPKKQYGFETYDSLGNDTDVSILGMPSEGDWILSASYNDKTLMRDVLSFKLSNAMGRYASRSRYCELVLNGQYMGVYIVFEKIKRNKNRVNVTKMSTADSTGDALTGGYIIKVDKDEGSDNGGWLSTFPPVAGSTRQLYFQFHYPKPTDISRPQATYIRNYFYSFESKMNSTSFNDSLTGYPKYIDINSFLDIVILNELSKNVDGYRLSSFMAKDRDSKGGKIVFGPIWDLNFGFGNANYYNASVIDGWYIDFLTTNQSFLSMDGFQAPFWWKKLFKDPKIQKALIERWTNFRRTVINTTYIYKQIDSITTLIDAPQKRNFEKWPILGTYVWPNAYYFKGETYQDQVYYLKGWIRDRINWIDKALGVTDAQDDKSISVPESYKLSQNYPNPFNPSTRIEYLLAKEGFVHLKIFDVLGKEIATLIEEQKPAGSYTIDFDAAKYHLNSGIYFYRLQCNEFSAVNKFILLK